MSSRCYVKFEFTIDIVDILDTLIALGLDLIKEHFFRASEIEKWDHDPVI